MAAPKKSGTSRAIFPDLRGEEGVITLFLVILIPVLIVGCIVLYSLIGRHSQESRGLKIAYSCSESYLSRYNAYMYRQFGIAAAYTGLDFEELMASYFVKNALVDTKEALESEISFEDMSSYGAFRESVLNAGAVVVAQGAIDATTELLESWTHLKAVQEGVHRIQKHSESISRYIEASKFTEELETLLDVEGSAELVQRVHAFRILLTDTHTHFSSELQSTLEAIERESNSELTAYLDTCKEGIHTTAEAYRAREACLMEMCSDVEALSTQLTTVDSALEAYTKIKANDSEDGDTSDLEAYNSLLSEREALMDAVRASISEQIYPSDTEKPGWLEGVKSIIEHAKKPLCIGDAHLNLTQATDYTAIDVDGQDSTLSEKIRINEYLLTIFSSYDSGSPRCFEFGNRHHRAQALRGEVEYLLTGKLEERSSLRWVQLQIFGIREVANLIYVVSNGRMQQDIATLLSAVPPPWNLVAHGVIVLAWSGAESYLDIKGLYAGSGYTFVKDPEQWVLDLETIVSGKWVDALPKSELSKAGDAPSKQSDKKDPLDPKLYYQDYMRLLLLLQNEEDTLRRAMTLIAVELDEASEGGAGLSDFSIGHTISLRWKAKMLLGIEQPFITVELENSYAE